MSHGNAGLFHGVPDGSRRDTRGMAHTSPIHRSLPARLPQLRWPLPALLAWAAGWIAMLALSRSGVLPLMIAVVAGLLVAGAPALFAATF